MNPTAHRPPMPERWWTYQRERFPLFAHGAMILSFSFCAVSYSKMLRDSAGAPSAASVVVAFVSCFLIFLQLRIADEFKDFEEDSKYRPYRPVPRGLVTLRELAALFALAAAVQLCLALWLKPMLAVVLLGVWTYLAAMSKEFFIGGFLRPRLMLYMVTHMAIMPQIDFYATSADWMPAGVGPPGGLLWFLAASFFNGMVIEVGRKIRAPSDEEHGVQTYSVAWGILRAVCLWWGVVALTYVCAVAAAARIHFAAPVAAILGVMLAATVALGVVFLRRPDSGRGKWIERISGLWTLVLYLSLGALPLLWRN